jgi:hypothetical protein
MQREKMPLPKADLPQSSADKNGYSKINSSIISLFVL